ncbi:MAG: hydrogenase maturation protease [Acidibrevibacterium sp.]|uniref:hydrogenase maturation protease n=1 Tax=Acidibrevibacterium sp. TaxID=2606776 RepID=UPI003D06E3E4
MSPRPVVIGLGNPDRGDDAVGLLVARRMGALGMPGIAVIEAGGDMLALLDHWAEAERVVLIDAAAPLTQPGRIHRFDPSLGPLPRDLALGSTHAFGLAEVLELARTLGRLPARLTIFAIEAARFDHGAALSAPVAGAAEAVAAMIAAELREACSDACNRLGACLIRRIEHAAAAHFREHFAHESRGGVAEGAALCLVESDDPSDPDALHLRLESLVLEV